MDHLLYQKLSSYAPLTALVPDIQPVMPPEDDPNLPYLYYWKLGSEESLTLAGPVRPRSYLFAIDFWSLTHTECKAIGDAVYAALNGWHDTEVQGCFRQTSAMQEEGGEPIFHGQSVYQIWS